MPPISVPTVSPLPPSQRVLSTSPPVFRILNRLARSSLISLVLDWLDDRNQALAAPYLAENPDYEHLNDLYPAAESLEELREFYHELQARRGAKREVVDRIIEGDWRRGLSLYQLAMADMQYLYDHPMSQKFTALKVVPLKNEEGHDDQRDAWEDQHLPGLPRFHPPTFLQNLQREVLPDVKVHYNLDRPQNLPLLLLRVYILDSPYNTSLALSGSNARSLDASKTIFVAFPDASPHVYVSLTTSVTGTAATKANNRSESRSLRKLLLDGLPKAFSRPRARYTLQPTGLVARTLEALLALRGQGRTNAAGGGWSIYASDERRDTPLNPLPPVPPPAYISDDEPARPSQHRSSGLKREPAKADDRAVTQRRKRVARARFGDAVVPGDGKAIEALHVRLEDQAPSLPEPLPPQTAATAGVDANEDGNDEDGDMASWTPDIRVAFHGAHVFAGLRELVEWGVVDGERMPGWMTGEEGLVLGR